jgi:hypothetical protein
MTMVDPLTFTVDALVARGALAEKDDEGALAVVPPTVAQELGIADSVRLVPSGVAEGTTACGMGSRLLENLVSRARARVPLAWARLDREPPRASHAAAMAERFVVRNGLREVGAVTLADGRYVVATFAYVAEADERHEGLVRVVVEADAGGAPDGSFSAELDPRSIVLTPSRGALFDATPVAGRIASRVDACARVAVAPIAERVARRFARDHARVAEYFGALVAEARAPRRRQDAAAINAKIVHLTAEREAKLRDLTDRYALRVSVVPAAIVGIVAPTARVSLTVRRRKAAREIVLRLPAGAESLDALACDGCEGTTSRPAVCDEKLHVLCEACVKSVTGRPICGACGAKRRGAREPDVSPDFG